MISKSVLKQYIDLKEEVKEVNERITKVEKRIFEIEKEISKLKRDKHIFKEREDDWFVDDVLIPELDAMIENLMLLKSSYGDRICTLNDLLNRISAQICEIEEFDENIDDVIIKQIFELRIKHGFPWKIVSARMGSMNSEDNLRSMFNRYLKKSGVR